MKSVLKSVLKSVPMLALMLAVLMGVMRAELLVATMGVLKVVPTESTTD